MIRVYLRKELINSKIYSINIGGEVIEVVYDKTANDDYGALLENFDGGRYFSIRDKIDDLLVLEEG